MSKQIKKFINEQVHILNEGVFREKIKKYYEKLRKLLEFPYPKSEAFAAISERLAQENKTNESYCEKLFKTKHTTTVSKYDDVDYDVKTSTTTTDQETLEYKLCACLTLLNYHYLYNQYLKENKDNICTRNRNTNRCMDWVENAIKEGNIELKNLERETMTLIKMNPKLANHLANDLELEYYPNIVKIKLKKKD